MADKKIHKAHMDALKRAVEHGVIFQTGGFIPEHIEGVEESDIFQPHPDLVPDTSTEKAKHFASSRSIEVLLGQGLLTFSEGWNRYVPTEQGRAACQNI